MVDQPVEELLERLYLEQVEGDAPSAEPPPADDVAAGQAAGLLRAGPDGPLLTETGLAAATSVIRRHRLAECLLVNVLAIGGQEMEDDACVFEHIIEPALEEKMCSLLGHPPRCPHGKAIPPGPCCGRDRTGQPADVTPLSEGQVNRDGTVVFLSARDQGEVQKLMAMGVLPGESIRLLRRFPSYVFQVGLSQFTIDRQLAERIQVRWEQRPGEGPGAGTGGAGAGRRCRRRRGRPGR